MFVFVLGAGKVCVVWQAGRGGDRRYFYLVLGLDVQFDFLAGQGADSAVFRVSVSR